MECPRSVQDVQVGCGHPDMQGGYWGSNGMEGLCAGKESTGSSAASLLSQETHINSPLKFNNFLLNHGEVCLFCFLR